MSLSTSLRAMSDGALLRLLRRRPDLAVPAPGDLGVLASRASVRHSIVYALDQLDTLTLAVLDALVVLGPHAARLQDVARLVGVDVAPAIEDLRSLALVWGADEALHVSGTVPQVLTYPAGLGRPAKVLGIAFDPAALADLDDAGRELLARLAAGPPVGFAQARAGSLVASLVARGLLARLDGATVELPREVGLALRGDRPLGDLAVEPPALVMQELAVDAVDAAGSGQVLESVRLLSAVLDVCAGDPPAVLRTGGIGVRDLRRLSRAVGVEPPALALLLEVARAADLLDSTGEPQRQWLPTTSSDGWRALPPEQRWVAVAQAWLDMPRQPGLAGERDDRDRVLAPLSEDLTRTGASEARRRALQAVADLPAGGAPAADSVAALLGWQAPRRGGRRRDDLVRWALAEAEMLGLTGRGAMTSYGAALLAGGEAALLAGGEAALLAGGEAATLLGTRLPAPLDHVLLQADLTAVAPGPLDPELAEEVALVADVESAGGATVYRITPQSVRRALDAGRTAGELHELFASRSRTPVPQALTYLVDDVARRHGGLRVGTAQAYLRCDDEALLNELLSDRASGPMRLRRIAPTVVVSAVRSRELLAMLRSAGYAPVQEAPDGSVVVVADERPRVPERPYRARAFLPPPRPSDAQLAGVVATLRSGDRASRSLNRALPGLELLPGMTTATTLGLLQEAAREGHHIRLSYVDSAGNATSRVVQPTSVGGGFLRAEDDRTETMHTFALHRITAAVRVDGAEPAD